MTQPDPKKPGKRKWPDNWYRDIWLFVTTILLVAGLKAGFNNTNEIQAGRVTGTQISCGINQSTLRANQRVIEGATAASQTPAQEQTLERLGFGNKTERAAQAKSLGAQYVLFVKREIVNFAGPQATNVIELVPVGKRKNRSFQARVNCVKLRSLTKIH